MHLDQPSTMMMVNDGDLSKTITPTSMANVPSSYRRPNILDLIPSAFALVNGCGSLEPMAAPSMSSHPNKSIVNWLNQTSQAMSVPPPMSLNVGGGGAGSMYSDNGSSQMSSPVDDHDHQYIHHHLHHHHHHHLLSSPTLSSSDMSASSSSVVDDQGSLDEIFNLYLLASMAVKRKDEEQEEYGTTTTTTTRYDGSMDLRSTRLDVKSVFQHAPSHGHFDLHHHHHHHQQPPHQQQQHQAIQIT